MSELTDPDETAARIARELGETEGGPQEQIRRIVARLGVRAALKCLEEALEIQARGGMRPPDQKRRRTVGAIFFHLIRTRTSPENQAFIWPPTLLSAKSVPDSFMLGERLTVLEESREQQRTMRMVRIKLMGRPGHPIVKGEVVLIGMHMDQVPALPRGLPAPPPTPTNYVVLVAKKQWLEVVEAIADPDELLVVEGFPVLDSQAECIAVFALNVTTIRLPAPPRAS